LKNIITIYVHSRSGQSSLVDLPTLNLRHVKRAVGENFISFPHLVLKRCAQLIFYIHNIIALKLRMEACPDVRNTTPFPAGLKFPDCLEFRFYEVSPNRFDAKRALTFKIIFKKIII